jgi:hypothetical protein
MSLIDAYFEACRVLKRVFDREFGRKPWRVLTIELISMCYEACMEHTVK